MGVESDQQQYRWRKSGINLNLFDHEDWPFIKVIPDIWIGLKLLPGKMIKLCLNQFPVPVIEMPLRINFLKRFTEAFITSTFIVQNSKANKTDCLNMIKHFLMALVSVFETSRSLFNAGS